MPDRYASYGELAMCEALGVDYAIRTRWSASPVAFIAIHGGRIEKGTTELAEAAAGEDCRFYSFEGRKLRRNMDLHITSTRFDEPSALALVKASATIVSIHGSADREEAVFLGGRDQGLRARIEAGLAAAGIVVGLHPNPALQGVSPANICNRGLSGTGVQLEVSRGLRERLLADATGGLRDRIAHSIRAAVLAG